MEKFKCMKKDYQLVKKGFNSTGGYEHCLPRIRRKSGMVSEIKYRSQKTNYWDIQHPKKMVKLNHSRKRLGYFSKFMGQNHFFEMDLLSGDFIIKPRHFSEIIPNFLWLKDDNSIIFIEKGLKKNKWKLGIYNTKTDLVFDFLNIKCDEIELIGLSPNEKEVTLWIGKGIRSGLYTFDLETKKLMKIASLQKEEKTQVYWAKNGKIFFTKVDEKREKSKSIWCMNIEGMKKEPFFEELKGTYEDIIGLTNRGQLLAVNIFERNLIKCGVIDIVTGEMQYVPTVNEMIKAVSSKGEMIIITNLELGNCSLYNVLTGEKWEIPVNGLVENMHFCIDDEFLIYTTYKNDQPIIELYDLVTLDNNPIVEMGREIPPINTIVIF